MNIHRRPRRFYSTPARVIFEKILKPVAQAFVIPENEGTFDRGLRMLFNVDNRDVYFAKVKWGFPIPGQVWQDIRSPHPISAGPGEISRRCKKGDAVVVRTDALMPERYAEIEFNEMVFVLTHAQFEVFKHKLEFVA